MKELLLQYATYNLWANRRLLETITSLDKQKHLEKIISSYSNLQLTLQHMMNAEYIWWQRMKLSEIPFIEPDEKMPVKDIAKKTIDYSIQWKEWIEKSSTNALEHEFYYRNSKKEQFKQPVFQMLIHLFNHQSYHRGQLVTMLRQLGIEKIPATDFIVWSRGKKN